MQAVQDFPWLISARSLQEFVDMVNFYHHFVSGAEEIMRPLYNLLREKLTHKVDWSVEGNAALAGTAMLAHLWLDAPIAITTDTSDCAVGAMQ